MYVDEQLIRSGSRSEVEDQLRRLEAEGWRTEEVRAITTVYRRPAEALEREEVVFAARAWKYPKQAA